MAPSQCSIPTTTFARRQLSKNRKRIRKGKRKGAKYYTKLRKYPRPPPSIMMTAASPHHTVVLAVELSPAVLLRPDCSPLELERELVPFVLSRTVTSDTSLVQEYMRSKVRGKNRLKEMTAKLVAEAGGEGAGFQRFLRKKYGCRLDWVADVVRFLEQEEGSSSSSSVSGSSSSRRTTGTTTPLRVKVVFYLSSVRLETPEAFARASQKTADVEAPKDGQASDFSFEMSRFDSEEFSARLTAAVDKAARLHRDGVQPLPLWPALLAASSAGTQSRVLIVTSEPENTCLHPRKLSLAAHLCQQAPAAAFAGSFTSAPTPSTSSSFSSAAGRAAAAARRSGATANAPRAEAFDSVSVLVLCPEILEDRLQALEQFSEKLGGICLHVRRRAEMQDFAPCLRMFLLHKNTSLIAERKRYYVLKQQQLKPSSPRRMQSSIAELVEDYLQAETIGSRQGSGGNEQLMLVDVETGKSPSIPASTSSGSAQAVGAGTTIGSGSGRGNENGASTKMRGTSLRPQTANVSPNDVLWGYLPSAHALRVLCETSQRVPARRWARSLRWLRSKRGIRDCLFGDQGALGLEMDELIPQRDEPASSGARRGNEELVRGGGGATASFLPSPYAPSPYANAANLSGEVAPLLGRDQDDMEIQESSYGPLIFNQAPERTVTAISAVATTSSASSSSSRGAPSMSSRPALATSTSAATIGSPVSASPLTRQKHVAPFVGGWSLRATHPPSSMLDLELGSRLVAVNFTSATILDPRGGVVGAAGQLGTGNIGRNKAEQHLHQVPEGGTNDVGGTKTVARMLKEQRPINAVFLAPGKLKQIHATFAANGGELQEQEDAEQNWVVADRVAALAEIVVADLRETWPPLLPDRAPLKRVAETMKEARERREPAGTMSRWQFHYAWERGKRCAKPLPFLSSVKPQSGEPPSAMVGAAAATSSSKLSTTSSGDVVAAASSQAVGSTGQMPGTTSASSDSAGPGDASASSSKGNLVDLGEQNHDASSSGGTSGAALDLPNSTVSANSSCKPKQLQLQAQHLSPGAIRLIVAFVGWLPFLARARRVSRAWRAALNHTGLWNWCVRFGTPIGNASLRQRYWEWLGARQWNLQDSRSTEREPADKGRDKGDNEHTVERAALLCLGFGKSPALSVQEHARAKLNAAAGFDAYTFLDRANLLLPLHFRLDTSLAECARLARQFQTMLCGHDLDLFRHFFTEGVAPELWFLMHAQTLLMDAFSSATLILRLWEIALWERSWKAPLRALVSLLSAQSVYLRRDMGSCERILNHLMGGGKAGGAGGCNTSACAAATSKCWSGKTLREAFGKGAREAKGTTENVESALQWNFLRERVFECKVTRTLLSHVIDAAEQT